jgi:hypothetical protein
MSMKSGFIFTLVEKYGLLEYRTNPTKIENETLKNFCKEYKEVSRNRDRDLSQYLLSSPTLFRTFIPYGHHFLNRVSEMVWYYDELLVSDPILLIVEKIEQSNVIDIYNLKITLHNTIIFLETLKDCIDEGFILFGGEDFYPTYNKELVSNDTLNALCNDLKIQTELDKLVDISIQKRQGHISGVIANYRGQQTMRLAPAPNEEGNLEASISFIGEFEKGTRLDLQKLDMMNIFDGLRENYIYEVVEILENLQIGQKNGAYIFYSRDLDNMVLQKLDNQNAPYKQEYNRTVFQAMLPFLKGINPEKIMELRLKMPEVFLEFRNYMATITLDATKQTGSNQELVNHHVQKEVNKLLLSLDTEQKVALRKARIIGAGTPIVSLLGTFAINTLGVDFAKYITLATGGVNVLAEINNINSYIDQKEKLKVNPLYFLWKVKK